MTPGMPFTKMVKSPISNDLKAHLEQVNNQLPGFEKLAFLAVCKDTWLPENGFLTPTMKIKRARLESEYSPLAQDWYDSKQPVVWQNYG